MAQIFSVPQYIPDATSGEVVTGYDVQSGVPSTGSAFITNWAELPNGPFTKNTNVLDPTGTYGTHYRVRPIRQVPYAGGFVTIDTPWSKPFTASTPLYDAVFTRLLLPTARFTYLGDQGAQQTNGTVLTETTGAGAGMFIFDGVTRRFNLQYVMNDDPIRVLEDTFTLVYTPKATGTQVALAQWDDYIVDPRAGTIEFKVAPLPGDYLRFDFRNTFFCNEDLMQMLVSGVNALSQYGINGYQVNTSYNLMSMNTPLKHPDLAEIAVKCAVLRLREGLTEAAMRGTTAWREGTASMDPFPSRALQFLVEKTNINDTHLRKEINTYIRGTTLPKGRGEFDIFWDLTSLTPLTSGMFHQMPGGAFGSVSSGLGSPVFPWYI